ncbi:replication initiation and membrane attachment protein [Thalassobacillus devorans]|uniref:Replication initiation and membrane attachment protein n=1 Tax=Thalassobacillus devorans TaxID=279813 RepID=A0ABQ1P8V8_9BACI|nr:DnaD domain protein [Thalassobacillus devorans]NIK29868.1 replication initiation and membrane attachment protein [Thalassobacillus devorans]GGC93498.1 replication initiation and membrane attachment protein [Thalassobacillus devorans]
MNQSIGKLLPVDGYSVQLNGSVPRDYGSALSHLYQPIIGVEAVTLYQTLLSEYDLAIEPEVHSHHTLMNYLAMPLDRIYNARRKLEAIGLMQTLSTEEESRACYIYNLQPPFSPEQFFYDDMLSLLLNHELGADKYNKLRNRFMRVKYPLTDCENITASFDEIFHGYQTSGPAFTARMPQKDSTLVTLQQANGPLLQDDRIDFNWIYQSLKEKMYPAEKILNVRYKRIMMQLASLYDLSSQDLEKAIGWALNEENQLNVAELKEACHDLSPKKGKVTSMKTIETRDKWTDTQADDIKTSKEEQFISMLERKSPKELLEDLSTGNEASAQDLKLIRDVMTEQGLSPGVMNVLVHYVLLKTDMKLSKAYLEKIASHWARKNVTTVRQAMTMAKAEHQKYQQWGKNNKSRGKKQTKEIIPDWFKENQNDGKRQEEKKSSSKVNKEEIAARIKRITNNGN